MRMSRVDLEEILMARFRTGTAEEKTRLLARLITGAPYDLLEAVLQWELGVDDIHDNLGG